jgi:hypothetical protein
MTTVAAVESSEVVAEQVRKATVLNEEALAVEVVDRRRDGGPTRWPNLAERVDGGGEEVTVATPVAAEERAEPGQSAVLVAAAQQKLGRAHRARGEDHDACADLAGDERTVLDPLEADPVAVRLGLDDAGDVERPHLGLTGLGLRIQGEVITRKTGVDLGSLMAVGVAAKLGQIQGRLSVAALGMSSPEITALFPLPSVIDETSIQRALEAIAVIKSKLSDTATTLTPQFVAVRITNPEAFGSI